MDPGAFVFSSGGEDRPRPHVEPEIRQRRTAPKIPGPIPGDGGTLRNLPRHARPDSFRRAKRRQAPTQLRHRRNSSSFPLASVWIRFPGSGSAGLEQPSGCALLLQPGQEQSRRSCVATFAGSGRNRRRRLVGGGEDPPGLGKGATTPPSAEIPPRRFLAGAGFGDPARDAGRIARAERAGETEATNWNPWLTIIGSAGTTPACWATRGAARRGTAPAAAGPRRRSRAGASCPSGHIGQPASSAKGSARPGAENVHHAAGARSGSPGL